MSTYPPLVSTTIVEEVLGKVLDDLGFIDLGGRSEKSKLEGCDFDAVVRALSIELNNQLRLRGWESERELTAVTPPRKDSINIYDRLPYEIASKVMRPGLHCDELARQIRAQLPAWLDKLSEEAYHIISDRSETK